MAVKKETKKNASTIKHKDIEVGVEANLSKRKVEMEITNPFSAGIDVGSRFHCVAIGQGESDVRTFGVYTADLHSLCEWLMSEGITTVALESTGSYWKQLFVLLEDYGLNPILVCGHYTKRQKKTDVKDARWIQKLHSMGLLPNSYQPDSFTEEIRTYSRHRQGLLANASDYIRKMQKALRLMNLRLDVAISDITGKSGKAIIEAILAGERDAKKLASLADKNIRKSTPEELIQALTGVWKEAYLFELRQCYTLYKTFLAQIEECDLAIATALEQEILDKEIQTGVQRKDYTPTKRKKKNKNSPKMDVQQLAYQLTDGIDLSEIEGVSEGTILTILSEVGCDLSDFPSAKAFTSWLRLCPNNRLSGGKILSKHTPPHKHRIAQALQSAANVIGNKIKTGYLHAFFQRVQFKKGQAHAIVATARKLGVIIWNMLTKKQAYNPQNEQAYNDNIRSQTLKNLNKKIRRMGIKPEELAFS